MRHRTPFHHAGVAEAQILIQRPGALILDVRDPVTFGRSHIAGAKNVNINSLSTIIESTARDVPILIYCYHGYASQEYAQMLSDFSFSEVYSLDGGYQAWSKAMRAAKRPASGAALRTWLAAQGFPDGDIDGLLANATTPLMKASHLGQPKIVRALIAAGAKLEMRNADGNNALWLACVGNHLDMADLLIKSGININNCNDNGATALMYAASTGKASAVALLLAAGADITLETLDGFSALDMAATIECLSLLRKASRDRERKLGEHAGREFKQINL